jgi:hypothetical protein
MKKTLTLIGVLVLAVMVTVIYAAIKPSNMSFRAGSRFYSVNIGTIDADADFPVFVAPYPGRITRAWITSSTALTGADTVTNYRDYSLISKGTDGTGVDTLCTYTTLHVTSGAKPATAYIPYSFGTMSTTKNYMTAGEVVDFRNEETGSATTLGNTIITIEFCPVGLNAPSGTPVTGTDQ